MLVRLLRWAVACLLFTTLAIAADPENWVPVRWWDASPKSFELLKGTPINCVVLPDSIRSEALITEAHRRKLAVLALASNPEEAPRALDAKTDGVVLEGAFRAGRYPTRRDLLSRPFACPCARGCNLSLVRRLPGRRRDCGRDSSLSTMARFCPDPAANRGYLPIPDSCSSLGLPATVHSGSVFAHRRARCFRRRAMQRPSPTRPSPALAGSLPSTTISRGEFRRGNRGAGRLAHPSWRR